MGAIDAAEAEFVVSNPLLLITWNFWCQYSNINVPDNRIWAMSASGLAIQGAAPGRVRKSADHPDGAEPKLIARRFGSSKNNLKKSVRSNSDAYQQ